MRTLLTAEEVQAGVRRLVEQIAATYELRPLTVLGVMTGSIVLLADLIRQLTMPLRVGVIQASSYRGGMAPGPLALQTDLLPELTGHEVLIVDDVFDTGTTLSAITARLQSFAPASLRTAVLLRKSVPRHIGLEPDFVGFDIPDAFVVGYGLDYRDQFRHLPFVAALDAEDLRQWTAERPE